MGYNLAIEYLADPEKTWMLESFKELDRRVSQPQHRALKEWLFLEVCFNPKSKFVMRSPLLVLGTAVLLQTMSSVVFYSSVLQMGLAPSMDAQMP